MLTKNVKWEIGTMTVNDKILKPSVNKKSETNVQFSKQFVWGKYKIDFKLASRVCKFCKKSIPHTFITHMDEYINYCKRSKIKIEN